MHALDHSPNIQFSPDKVILGCWQLAGGHGDISPKQAVDILLKAYALGFRYFDCADIYTGVEEIIGSFREQAGSPQDINVHTKFVPDLELLGKLGFEDVEKIITRSLGRLKTDCLDLVQFHWWDYSVPGYVEAAHHLLKLKEQGKIKEIGVTNFDTERLVEIISSGVPIVSSQNQYSVLDTRPSQSLERAAAQRGFSILCYGTLAGGFLSERYLGQPEPAEELENRSLVKYKLIIDEAGGWEVFQRVLRGVKSIAEDLGVSISQLCSAYMLHQPRVASVILGLRNDKHLEQNSQVASLSLAPDQRLRLNSLFSELKPVPGEVYSLERDREGRHGKIMKYNLNTD